jgi:SMC interacting uncharacterized protein involved in chromosome segregation
MTNLDKEIKGEKLRIEDLTQQNKDSTKRLAQATSKYNELKTTYPEF